jgi:hypothetical protein
MELPKKAPRCSLLVCVAALAACTGEVNGRDSDARVGNDAGSRADAESRNDAGSALDGASSVDAASLDAGTDGGFTPPKRLVLVYFPAGVVGAAWRPSGGERDFTLSPILEPFEPLREKLLVVNGIDLRWPHTCDPTLSFHGVGPALLFTGAVGAEAPSEAEHNNYFLGGGPSLDRVAASSETRLATLNLTPEAGPPIIPELRAPHYVTWSAVDTLAMPLRPSDAFAAAFDGSPLTPELEALRDEIAATDPLRNDSYPAVLRQSFAIAREALVHDLTRSVTLQLATYPSVRPTWITTPPELSSLGWHDFTHYAFPSDSREAVVLTQLLRWVAQQVADFAASLDAIPEGSGTMLDNTLIVLMSSTGEAASHSADDLPVVILGNAGGELETGRFVTVERLHYDLLLTIAQRFDPTLTALGDETMTTGPITELLAR